MTVLVQDWSWSSDDELAGKLREAIKRKYPDQLTSLSLTREGDTLVLGGSVGSEEARTGAALLLYGFDGVMKVRNHLVVQGFFEPASDEDESFFSVPRRSPSARKVIRYVRRHSYDGGSRDDFGAIEFGFGIGDDDVGGADAGPDARFDSQGGEEEDAERADSDGTEAVAPVQPSPAPGRSDVSRFPSVDQEGLAAPGADVVLRVDLRTEAAGSERAVVLGSFQPGWGELRIGVQISSPSLIAQPDMGTIVVREDGSSDAAILHCRVAEDWKPETALRVLLYFFHGTRICGHAEWSLDVDPAVLQVGDEAIEEVVTEARPPVRIVPQAAGPTLTVMISKAGGDTFIWNWIAALPGGRSVGSDAITIDGKAFAEGLLRTCPALSPDRFRRTMRGLGERIWKAAPGKFQTAMLGYRAVLTEFPIQFVSDDPHVPWEMMVLPEADHLFLDHPVTRWPLSGVSPMANVLPRGDLLSFVPEYEGNATLPAARDEGAWIVRKRGAIQMRPLRQAMLDVFDGKHAKPVALLHFAGHGRTDAGGFDAGIRLEDEWIVIDEVGQSNVVIGERYGTLAFLNACETGGATPVLGMNWGWGEALAARSFGGVVAPLWKVEDAVAGEMLKVFLPALMDGSATLGEAVRAARVAHSGASVSSMAYVAHGDVMARIA